MSETFDKTNRAARFLRAHFSKLILFVGGISAFWMLKARLDKAPLGKPPELPVAQVQLTPDQAVQNSLELLRAEHLTSEESVELSDNTPSDWTIPEEAIARFNARPNRERPISLSAKRSVGPFARKARPKFVTPAPVSAIESDPSDSISLEANWDVGPEEAALDANSPLGEIFKTSWQETALLGNYDSNALQSLVQIAQATAAEQELPAVPRVVTAVGVLKPNDFAAERSALQHFQTEFESTEVATALPEEARTIDLAGPAEVIQADVTKPILSVVDQKRTLDARQELSSIESNDIDTVAPRIEQAPKIPNVLEAKIETPATDSVTDAALSPEARVIPSNQISPPVGKVISTTQVADSVVDSHDDTQRDSKPVPSRLIGELSLADDATAWLDARKGHIELYLQAATSRDMQDTVFLDYRFPEREFEISGEPLARRYQLMAAVQLPGNAMPYSTVAFPSAIDRDTRGKLNFHINKEQLLKKAADKKRSGSVSLTFSVFEALSGNYRKPPSIPGASVEIVGMLNENRLAADAEGTVRVARTPVNSELVVRVAAPGFLPTERIVPIFESPAYYPIYLVPQEKVTDTTHYFTRNPQQETKSLWIGRVFDVSSRLPKVDEKFSISYRRGKPLYFGALPDPNLDQTTSLGLFGFFNIAPSFRVLSRPDATYGLLHQLRPGFGYYVEWGRGGSKPIRGRIEDPFNPKALHAKISWLEKTDKAIETDPTNRFEFTGIDLPPSVVTLEIDVVGYPRTWHTIPWSTRERADERVLHVIESDLLRENSKSFSKKTQSSGSGMLVGGAAPGFFARTQCVRPELLTLDGQSVSNETGPYYFSKRRYDKDEFCLTAQQPGFSYVNLDPGEYVLQFFADKKLLRTKVVRIGADRVSIAVQ